MNDFVMPDTSNFEQIDLNGRFIIDDRPDMNELDMNELPEIAHAALQVIEAVEIDDARFTAYQHNDVIIIRNEVNTLYPSEGPGPSLLDEGVTLQNADSHIAGVTIRISPDEEGGYNMQINTVHMGDMGPHIDMSETKMFYEISEDGEILSRDGRAHTQEYGVSISDQDHGQWTIDLAQTVENNFLTAIGLDADQKSELGRPDGAATSFDESPGMAENTSSLSAIINGLGADSAVPQVEQGLQLGQP